MTLNQTDIHESIQTQAVQYHHLRAAEHFDHAAKCHKEAAKLHQAGDYRAAKTQVQAAREHVAKAGGHVIEADKRDTFAPASLKMTVDNVLPISSPTIQGRGSI